MSGPHIGDSVKFRSIDTMEGQEAPVYAGIVRATHFVDREPEPVSYDVFVPLHDITYTVFPEQLVDWPGKDKPEAGVLTWPKKGDKVKFQIRDRLPQETHAGVVEEVRKLYTFGDAPQRYQFVVRCPLHDDSYVIDDDYLMDWPRKVEPELSDEERRVVDLLQGRPFPIAPGRYGPGHPLHDARSYAEWNEAHAALRAEMGTDAYAKWYGEAFEAALWLLAPRAMTEGEPVHAARPHLL